MFIIINYRYIKFDTKKKKKNKRINSCIANNWIINRTTDVVRANLSPPFSFFRKRNKENVQRTQITFSSDKASLPRTRHNNVSRAILSLKAACSTLDLVRATCQYPSLSVFSVKGYERRGRREGINISRELITALDRYKVCIRERERSRKSIAQPCLRAKCLPRKPAGNR